MDERLICIDCDDGEVGVTLGANYYYFQFPFAFTIVGVSASPSADDADATIDINDDGSAAVAAVDCSDQNVPGTWESTHFGGTETPVFVAADSKVSLDANSAASGTRIHVKILALVGVS